MQARRHRAEPQHQRGLDQAGKAGRSLGVPQVRLDRADQAARRPCGAFAKHGSQGTEFNRVTGSRPGAVRLDVDHPGRCDASVRVRCAERILLTRAARSSEAAAGPAIVPDGAPPDQGMDAVAVGERPVEGLEQDRGDALTADVSVTVRITELAASVRRHHPALRVRDADVGLQDDIHAGRDRLVALAVKQASAGQVHRDQG